MIIIDFDIREIYRTIILGYKDSIVSIDIDLFEKIHKDYEYIQMRKKYLYMKKR
jgi:hypothetical protein